MITRLIASSLNIIPKDVLDSDDIVLQMQFERVHGDSEQSLIDEGERSEENGEGRAENEEQHACVLPDPLLGK